MLRSWTCWVASLSQAYSEDCISIWINDRLPENSLYLHASTWASWSAIVEASRCRSRWDKAAPRWSCDSSCLFNPAQALCYGMYSASPGSVVGRVRSRGRFLQRMVAPPLVPKAQGCCCDSCLRSFGFLCHVRLFLRRRLIEVLASLGMPADQMSLKSGLGVHPFVLT